MLAVVAALVTMALISSSAQTVAQELTPQPVGAGVYFFRLRPSLPGARIDAPGDFRAAYDRLRPTLLKLEAGGQVVSFELLAEIGSVRVVALEEGAVALASRPEVADVEPQPLHRRSAPDPRPLAAQQSTDTPRLRPQVIGQSYTISGTVRDYDGTPLQSVYVKTEWDDPTYVGDWTDASGYYSLTVTAGTYHVNAGKYGLPNPPEQTVTVPPNQVVDFAFPQRYTIRGTVRDHDGTPVQDARVTTEWGDPVYDSDQTDATGAYTLTVIAGTYTIGASKDGYPDPGDQEVTVPPDASGVDFAFPQQYTIRGTVRDHDGSPVQDARVTTEWGDPVYDSDQTDATGAYTLTVIAGTYTIGASEDGYPDPGDQEVTVPPDASGVDFAFPQPYDVTGTIRDQTGSPVQGASVWGGVNTGTTAADGTYTIVAGPGEHYVSARKTGYESAPSVLVPLPPAASGVDFVLREKDQTIRGQVVDDQGLPVPDALVWAANLICYSWGRDSTSTSADGSYTLTVAPGIYHVEASKDGYVPAGPKEVAAPEGGTSGQADFTLEPAAYSIRGTVLDHVGQPVETVSISASACGLSYNASTDATGAYTLTVNADTFTVSAYDSDYPKPDSQVVSVPPSATGVDFTMPAAYTITGQVTDNHGSPVKDAFVWTSGDAPDYDTDWTDASGEYILIVRADTYEISARKDEYDRPDARTVSVPPYQTGVDFSMSAGNLSIQGMVRDATGDPLPLADVYTQLSGESSSSWYQQVYYNGTYSMTRQAGLYSVRASVACHTYSEQREVTLPPSQSGIDFSVSLRDRLVSGIVSDTVGLPICGAWVAGENGVSDYDSTERNGRYALQLPAGTYTVEASESGYGDAPDQMVTVPPHATGTDFVLPAPNNTIQGTVRDNHGAAVAGATMHASGSAGSASGASGADGGYTLRVPGWVLDCLRQQDWVRFLPC